MNPAANTKPYLPMFDPKSRYAKTTQYTAVDQRGRTVSVVAVPPAPNAPMLGIHLLKQGQRPDHLAAKYLADPTGFWRIAEANDAMLPDALAEQLEITIPMK
jgi:hypothetical protein